MALDGQSFVSIRQAYRTINATMNAAREQAVEAGIGGMQSRIADRFPTEVRLATISDATFDSVWNTAFDQYAWFNDAWCSGRSLALGQMFADAAGMPLGASIAPAGRLGSSQALAGAVAIARGPLTVGRAGTWSYHAVGVALPRSEGVPMAADGLLFRRPVPLEEWADRIGVAIEDVQLRHPWDLRGLQIHHRTDAGIAQARRALRSSVPWFGQRLDNPLMRGTPITGPTAARTA